VAHQSPGDDNVRKRYTLVMLAFHLCKELQSDKIEIRIGVDCLYCSLDCASVHLDSVRPLYVGLFVILPDVFEFVALLILLHISRK
jgi:hypothetical protein